MLASVAMKGGSFKYVMAKAFRPPPAMPTTIASMMPTMMPAPRLGYILEATSAGEPATALNTLAATIEERIRFMPTDISICPLAMI